MSCGKFDLMDTTELLEHIHSLIKTSADDLKVELSQGKNV